jgi:hypothetical protein
VEELRIQAASDLARISHLRIRQTSVGKAVNQNSYGFSDRGACRANMAISLRLQLNAPILCEGLAVETRDVDRSLLTSEIPPSVS